MPVAGHRKKLIVAVKERPESVSTERWDAVPRIAEYANAHRFGADVVAKAAGVGKDSVSKWMSRTTTPELETIWRIEKSWSVEFVSKGDVNAGNYAPSGGVAEVALGLGLDPSITRALMGSGGEGLRDLDESLKRAVLGVVHVFGHPLEIVVPIAKRLAKTRGPKARLSPAEWMEAIRADEELPRRPPSGTFPMKIAR